MMSDPELPYKISSSEEITKIVDDLLLHLYKIRLHDIKVHQHNQTMLLNFKLQVQPHQRNQTMLRNSKIQMQPQAVPASDFSILTNPTSRKFVASSDLDPDPSADLDSGGVIAQGFRGPSNHDPHISRLRTQTRFFTPLSCDLEPDINKHTPRKIVISSDLVPDPSDSLGS